MLVDAAPVTSIFKQPFVVSADSAMPQLGVLSRTVVAELTSTVEACPFSLRINPSIFHAAQSVPSVALSLATIVPWNAKAELLFNET